MRGEPEADTAGDKLTRVGRRVARGGHDSIDHTATQAVIANVSAEFRGRETHRVTNDYRVPRPKKVPEPHEAEATFFLAAPSLDQFTRVLIKGSARPPQLGSERQQSVRGEGGVLSQVRYH